MEFSHYFGRRSATYFEGARATTMKLGTLSEEKSGSELHLGELSFSSNLRNIGVPLPRI
jgi:hypothetical protein